MHHFAIYEIATGAVVESGRGSNPAVIEMARARLSDGQALYEGLVNPNTEYLPGGIVAPKPAETVDVSRSAVKSHAARLLSYSDWYVTRRADTGEDMPAAIAVYRQAVRDASDMDPIPADFIDPKYWPSKP